MTLQVAELELAALLPPCALGGWGLAGGRRHRVATGGGAGGVRVTGVTGAVVGAHPEAVGGARGQPGDRRRMGAARQGQDLVEAAAGRLALDVHLRRAAAVVLP